MACLRRLLSVGGFVSFIPSKEVSCLYYVNVQVQAGSGEDGSKGCGEGPL